MSPDIRQSDDLYQAPQSRLWTARIE